MKTLRCTFLIGLAALTVFASSAEDTDAVKKDQAMLQGEWAMVSGERAGQAMSAESVKSSKRIAAGDQTTVTVQGQVFMKAKFTLDPTKSPKAIDYAVSVGHYAGKTQLGIYQLDGDELRFCFSIPGNARPKDFTSKSDDGRTVSVWRRAGK